jgi:hypothetical protein
MLVYGTHGAVMRFFIDPYAVVATAGLGAAR